MNAAKVLIVEDDDQISTVMQRGLTMLLEKGVERITVARTLAEAVQSIGIDSPDVILLDLSLPDTHDLQGLLALRHDFPDIPVIVVNGYDDATVRVEASTHGAFGFISKISYKGIDLAMMVGEAVIFKNVEARRRAGRDALDRLDEALAKAEKQAESATWPTQSESPSTVKEQPSSRTGS